MIVLLFQLFDIVPVGLFFVFEILFLLFNNSDGLFKFYVLLFQISHLILKEFAFPDFFQPRWKIFILFLIQNLFKLSYFLSKISLLTFLVIEFKIDFNHILAQFLYFLIGYATLILKNSYLFLVVMKLIFEGADWKLVLFDVSGQEIQLFLEVIVLVLYFCFVEEEHLCLFLGLFLLLFEEVYLLLLFPDLILQPLLHLFDLVSQFLVLSL